MKSLLNSILMFQMSLLKLTQQVIDTIALLIKEVNGVKLLVIFVQFAEMGHLSKENNAMMEIQ